MAIDILKRIWPEWEIGKRLGGGSYGVVYEARRSVHGVESYAAIKIISIPANESELDSLLSERVDAEASRRYLQEVVDDCVKEIRVMEALQGSANIVNVTDYQVAEKTGELGWYIFIRMELLTPFSVFVCDKKLSEADVIKLGCDICTALDICEKQNIIHRDIKPGNILVHKTGDFKLGDFGIARNLENATMSMSQKYSPNYVAPEVISNSRYDARVDIYSLGLVLYRLMNNDRPPFLEEKQLHSPNERKRAIDRRIHGEALPVPCEASPAMAEVILRACAFDPNDRFSSAAEMKEALLSVRNGTYRTGQICSQPQKQKTGQDEPEETGNKSRLWIAILGLLAAALVIFVPKFLSEEITQTSLILHSKPTKTEYYVGDTLDTSGLALTALYSDGSFQTINSGFTCSPVLLDEPGTQLITVSCGGQDTSFTVTVTEKSLTEIAVENMPTKTTYYKGDTLNTFGLTLTATYSDGSTRTINSGFTCQPMTLNHVGEQTISVSYAGKTTVFVIIVEDAATTENQDTESNGSGNDKEDTAVSGEDISSATAIAEQETVSIADTCEFHIDYIDITEDVMPPRPGDWYSHYEAEDGKVYVDICVGYKNLTTKERRADELIDGVLIYGGKYRYDGTLIVEEDSRSDFAYSSSAGVAPLTTEYLHYLFEVPAEVATGVGELAILFEVEGNLYIVTVRDGAEGEVAPHNTNAVEKTDGAVTVGEIIAVSDICEFFVDYSEITGDVIPPRPGDCYSHYEANDGKVYVDLCVGYKHWNTVGVAADEVMSAVLIYADEYEYTGFSIIEEDSRSDFTYSEITDIAPLTTEYLHYLFEVPAEVATGAGELTIRFKVEGNFYIVTVREGTEGEVAPHNKNAVEKTGGAVTDGEIVAVSHVGEFFVDYSEITGDVIPPRPGDWYTNYEANDGKVYVDLCVGYKHWNTVSVAADEVMSAVLIYAGQYEYTGFSIIEEDSRSDFTYTGITDIAPLTTEYLHYLFEVPAEVATSNETIVIEFVVFGNTYLYQLR